MNPFSIRQRASAFVATFASALLLLTSAPRAAAHDPGLSTAHLRMTTERIEVSLVFAVKDAGELASALYATDETSGAWTPAATTGALARYATNAIEATLDDQPVPATRPAAAFDDAGNITIHLTLAGVPQRTLRLHFAWLAHLPLGHRQFLTAQRTDGSPWSEQLLSAKDDAVTLKVEPSPQNTSRYSPRQQRMDSLSSLGGRRGPGRGGLSDAGIAPHPGPLPIRASWGEGEIGSDVEMPPSPVASPDTSSNNAARWVSLLDFLGLGVKHILIGYDHLLFLFSLLIVSRRLMATLKVITAFTVAHSITLALATFDAVRIPSSIVEPLIAASIVFVALENLLRREIPASRLWLVFGFGLVHGLGFASVLRELGVGANGGNVVLPLVSFNLGVELGQLLVALPLVPLLAWAGRRPAFERRWVPACSVIALLAGGFWLVDRLLSAA